MMKLLVIAGAALLSVGWALSESRPRRHLVIGALQEPPPLTASAPDAMRPLPAPMAMRPLPATVAAPRKPAAPAVATLSGRIVDGQGQPRSDAKADLDLGALCIWIYTDGDGNFAATVAPGEYQLHAVNDDDLSGATISVSLHPGEEVQGLVLELAERPTLVEPFTDE